MRFNGRSGREPSGDSGEVPDRLEQQVQCWTRAAWLAVTSRLTLRLVTGVTTNDERADAGFPNPTQRCRTLLGNQA